MQGPFIVFEGGEGSGKTTHAELFTQYLRDTGTTASLTLEPGGTPFGTAMRSLILSNAVHGPIDARAELFCFLADRAQHCAQYIVPRLHAGETVVCDRFSGSTYAYQIGGRALPEPEFIIAMDTYARAGLTPDVVVYLDIDPEQGVMRKQRAGQELNRLDVETLGFHRRVRAYFLQLAKQENWIVIPTVEGTQEENQRKIREAIEQRLKK